MEEDEQSPDPIDGETQEDAKIRRLAHTLKSLHLAGTLEEAYARAREMMLSGRGESKSIMEMNSEQALTQELGNELRTHEQRMSEFSAAVAELKQKAAREEEQEIAGDAEKIDDELDKIEEEIADVEKEQEEAAEAVKKAEKVVKK